MADIFGTDRTQMLLLSERVDDYVGVGLAVLFRYDIVYFKTMGI
jgi:hypothetical protein